MHIIYLLLVFFISCGPLGVYKVDLEQGNKISEFDLSRLDPGLSREEVSGILGDNVYPIEKDLYSYYAYTNKQRSLVKKQVRLKFINDVLQSYEVIE